MEVTSGTVQDIEAMVVQLKGLASSSASTPSTPPCRSWVCVALFVPASRWNAHSPSGKPSHMWPWGPWFVLSCRVSACRFAKAWCMPARKAARPGKWNGSLHPSHHPENNTIFFSKRRQSRPSLCIEGCIRLFINLLVSSLTNYYIMGHSTSLHVLTIKIGQTTKSD
jgi:hypothetical protein